MRSYAAFLNPPLYTLALTEDIKNQSLSDAVKRIEAGLIDADLGGGLIKQRVARKGEGKSGGFRTLLAYRAGDKVYFLHGFAKKDSANIDQQTLKLLRLTAKNMLMLNDKQIIALLTDNKIVEIFDVYHNH